MTAQYPLMFRVRQTFERTKVRNTLDLVQLECSVAYGEQAQGRSDLEIISRPRGLPFDSAGNLPDHVLDW